MNVRSRTPDDQEDDDDARRQQQQQQQQQESPSSPSRASSSSVSALRLPPLSLVSTCEEMNPSRRSTFEDCSVYHPAGTWSAPDPNMAIVAVIDGHGGRDIVEYLETGLTYHISQELQQQQQQQPQQDDNTNNDNDNNSNSTMGIPPNATRPTRGRAEETSGSRRSSSIASCLERAFLMADIHSKSLGVTSSGATVAVCLVTRGKSAAGQTTTEGEGRNTWTIHAANAGDARIVLSDQGRAVRMTHDHRTDDPAEVKRIEDSGGFVFKGRVLGVLAVTRSLGDHCMKEYVIAKPYTFQRTITMVPSWNDDNDAEADDAKQHSSFLIVGCDGLWDVMQDQDAVDFVIERLAEKELVAKFLVEEALKRGSTDNITVSVAFLT